MHSFPRFVAFILLALLAGGCANQQFFSLDEAQRREKSTPIRYLALEHEPQQAAEGCGIAALVSVLRYWQLPADQAELYASRPPVDRKNGYSLGELKTLAREAGLHTYTFTSDTTAVQQHLDKGRPLILPLKLDTDYIYQGMNGFTERVSDWITFFLSERYNHYVVAIGYDAERLWVMDPILGVRAIEFATLETMWSPNRYAVLLASK